VDLKSNCPELAKADLLTQENGEFVGDMNGGEEKSEGRERCRRKKK
jgi:hypothetical protein